MKEIDWIFDIEEENINIPNELDCDELPSNLSIKYYGDDYDIYLVSGTIVIRKRDKAFYFYDEYRYLLKDNYRDIK